MGAQYFLVDQEVPLVLINCECCCSCANFDHIGSSEARDFETDSDALGELNYGLFCLVSAGNRAPKSYFAPR